MRPLAKIGGVPRPLAKIGGVPRGVVLALAACLVYTLPRLLGGRAGDGAAGPPPRPQFTRPFLVEVGESLRHVSLSVDEGADSATLGGSVFRPSRSQHHSAGLGALQSEGSAARVRSGAAELGRRAGARIPHGCLRDHHPLRLAARDGRRQVGHAGQRRRALERHCGHDARAGFAASAALAGHTHNARAPRTDRQRAANTQSSARRPFIPPHAIPPQMCDAQLALLGSLGDHAAAAKAARSDGSVCTSLLWLK